MFRLNIDGLIGQYFTTIYYENLIIFRFIRFYQNSKHALERPLLAGSCQERFLAIHPTVSILDRTEMPTVANVGEDQTIDALDADQAAFHRPAK